MAVIVGVPVLYVVSFGPMCWWFSSAEIDGDVVVYIAPHAYWPIGWLAQHGPDPVGDAINWYGTLWIYWVWVPVNLDGDRWIAFVQQNR